MTTRNALFQVHWFLGITAGIVIALVGLTGGLPGDLNWAALADPQATTVVFMGKRTLPALVEGLAAHGLPGDTPAILAESVGHPEESLTRGTLASLVALLADRGEAGKAPGLILYGPLAG